VYSVYSAADFRPMSSATQVAWVDIPRPGFDPARGITPVNQADTFYVRLDTPPNARDTKAMLEVMPASGSIFNAWLDRATPTGDRFSGSAVSELPASGKPITVEMYGYTAPGEASYLKFRLSPGEVVLGLLVRYRPRRWRVGAEHPPAHLRQPAGARPNARR
jgi:hypothetical protein